MVYDIAMVGGGIVGLATARELFLRHPRLRLCCRRRGAVHHPSDRPQQRGHPRGHRLQARFAQSEVVRGRRKLWQYCASGHPVPQVGKLIVATEERELGRLEDLYARGQQNGIESLEMLDAAAIEEREPYAGACGRSFAGDRHRRLGRRRARLRCRRQDDGRRHVPRSRGARHRAPRRHDATHTNNGEMKRATSSRAAACTPTSSRLTGGKRDPKIVPFRGDYLILKPEKALPRQGQHLSGAGSGISVSRRALHAAHGRRIWLGPNAVLAFAREGYSFLTINPPEL